MENREERTGSKAGESLDAQVSHQLGTCFLSPAVRTGGTAVLNPAHSRYLMAYREVWDLASPGFMDWEGAQVLIEKLALKGTETPLCPPLLQNS